MLKNAWKSIAATVLSFSVLVSVGCQTVNPTPLGKKVEIVKKTTGDSDVFFSPTTRLIRTQADYNTLGNPSLHPDEVDFDRFDMVFTTLGIQNIFGGPDQVDIKSIRQVGDELVITTKNTISLPDLKGSPYMVHPYAVAIIEKTDATDIQHIVNP